MCCRARLDYIFDLVRSENVALIWVGFSFGSFGRARRGKPGGVRPGPVRDDSTVGVWGLPSLSARSQAKVNLENLQVSFLTELVNLCIFSNTRIIVENSLSSRWWNIPSLNYLIELGSTCVFDACQFGSSKRGTTRLAAWNVDVTFMSMRCLSLRNVCSKSGSRHLNFKTSVLSATSRRTFASSAYCGGLVLALVLQLLQALRWEGAF